ncbi:hypothetical protein BDZ89DRAFT_1045762 [Hymenopellis radicata]|nr:hypothetical protein BDZ89DRAFT_1045762 [Hymenopellis radicata]
MGDATLDLREATGILFCSLDIPKTSLLTLKAPKRLLMKINCFARYFVRSQHSTKTLDASSNSCDCQSRSILEQPERTAPASCCRTAPSAPRGFTYPNATDIDVFASIVGHEAAPDADSGDPTAEQSANPTTDITGLLQRLSLGTLSSARGSDTIPRTRFLTALVTRPLKMCRSLGPDERESLIRQLQAVTRQGHDLEEIVTRQNREEVFDLREEADKALDALKEHADRLAVYHGLPLFIHSSSSLSSLPLSEAPEIVQISAALALIGRYFGRTGRDFLDLLMKSFRFFAEALVGEQSTAAQREGIHSIPKTYETVERMLSLNIKTVPYAVCTSCHVLHKPVYRAGSSSAHYPELCDAKEFSSGPCNTVLTRDGKAAQDVRVLPLSRVVGSPSQPTGGCCLDATILSCSHQGGTRRKAGFRRRFLCAKIPMRSQKLFIRERGREDRFLHSMNVDFFNIEGNRIRGPVRSMGVISVLTYNIPGSHHDDPAYIYIPGLIPGITEPRAVLAHIRHYLVPFLEDLKIAYIRGIHISPLPSAAEGRLFRSALAVVVCDRKAAVSVGGFTDVTSNIFCVQCQLQGQRHVLETDDRLFIPCDHNTMRRNAEKWEKQPTLEDALAFAKKVGSRSSAFWILPYWNPVEQLVVDPMHVWSRTGPSLRGLKGGQGNTKQSAEAADKDPDDMIDIDEDDADDELPIKEVLSATVEPEPLSHAEEALRQQNFNEITKGDLDAAVKKLEHALEKQSMHHALKFVCADLNCLPSTGTGRDATKAVYAQSLASWRKTMPIPPLQWVDFSSREARERIQQVIREIITPSWMGSVPHDFGTRVYKSSCKDCKRPPTGPDCNRLGPILRWTGWRLQPVAVGGPEHI